LEGFEKGYYIFEGIFQSIKEIQGDRMGKVIDVGGRVLDNAFDLTNATYIQRLGVTAAKIISSITITKYN